MIGERLHNNWNFLFDRRVLRNRNNLGKGFDLSNNNSREHKHAIAITPNIGAHDIFEIHIRNMRHVLFNEEQN